VLRGTSTLVILSNSCGLVKCASPTAASASPARLAAVECFQDLLTGTDDPLRFLLLAYTG